MGAEISGGSLLTFVDSLVIVILRRDRISVDFFFLFSFLSPCFSFPSFLLLRLFYVAQVDLGVYCKAGLPGAFIS